VTEDRIRAEYQAAKSADDGERVSLSDLLAEVADVPTADDACEDAADQSPKERKMLTITARDAHESLVALIRQINDDHSAITITSPAGNGVLISEEDYTAWKANMHLFAMPSNARRIVEALERSEREPGQSSTVERIIGRNLEPDQVDATADDALEALEDAEDAQEVAEILSLIKSGQERTYTTAEVTEAEDHTAQITRRDGEPPVLMSQREADARAALLQFAADLITVTLDDQGTLASRMADRFQWMLALSPEDQAKCAQDLVNAAQASFATGQPHLAIAELTSWRETATAIAAGLSSHPSVPDRGERRLGRQVHEEESWRAPNARGNNPRRSPREHPGPD
jgi:PHD/YefM family antitoxin component YafN of YafNO toxin-antitoxin module